MSAEQIKQRLETIEAPYKRLIWLDDVEFESGMKLLRVTIREGRRITQLDVDPVTAKRWGDTMVSWAKQRNRDA